MHTQSNTANQTTKSKSHSHGMVSLLDSSLRASLHQQEYFALSAALFASSSLKNKLPRIVHTCKHQTKNQRV